MSMSPTPEQLNAVADWLEAQAAEVELHDVREGLARELKQLGQEHPSLRAIVEEAKAAGQVDEESRQRFWRHTGELLSSDLERKRRIAEMLRALIQANEAVKAKHANGTTRTPA
jgi:transposase